MHDLQCDLHPPCSEGGEVDPSSPEAVPQSCTNKYVGLYYEYTDSKKNVKLRNLPSEQRQRAAVLQLFVAYETLSF
jgi:hypothetical protein